MRPTALLYPPPGDVGTEQYTTSQSEIAFNFVSQTRAEKMSNLEEIFSFGFKCDYKFGWISTHQIFVIPSNQMM